MAKFCRRSGKFNHRSENAARVALARVASSPAVLTRRYVKTETDYYKCPHCPYWHLTSQSQGRTAPQSE
jgi:hypothetical protein